MAGACVSEAIVAPIERAVAKLKSAWEFKPIAENKFDTMCARIVHTHVVRMNKEKSRDL